MSYPQPQGQYPMSSPQSSPPSPPPPGSPPQGHPPQAHGYPGQPIMSYTAQPQMQPIPGGDEKRTTTQQQMYPAGVPVAFKPGSFQHNLCGCCNACSTCCLGCWCPCILFGRTRARLKNPHLRRDQLPCVSGDCVGFGAVCLFCPGFQCIFGWMNRGDIRAKYDIEGNGCTDCLAHWCCDCCVCVIC